MSAWKMGRGRHLAALVLSLALAPGVAAAAAPALIPVEGNLATAQGAPVDGAVTLHFRLYATATGGTALHTETQDVTASNGVFSAYLGRASTLDLALFRDHGTLFLGIAVNSDPEAQPRLEIGSGAYAGFAQYSTEAASVPFAGISGLPASLNDGDQDTLGGLSCADGQVARRVGSAWSCGADADTLGAMSCADGAVPRFSGGGWACGSAATSAAWADITGRPTGLDDGDNDTLAAVTGCSPGQQLMYGGGGWTCTDAATFATVAAPLGCSTGEVPVRTASGWGCTTPSAGSTPPVCNGAGQALQFDGTNWQCVVLGNSRADQGQALGGGIRDSWGNIWDGLERPAATYANAKADCAARGGRLPLGTELWRVSAAPGIGNGEVGQTYNTNWNRALNPFNPNNHMMYRLSDAAAAYGADATVYPYRCVWPVNAGHTAFTGSSCHGPPGQECMAGVANNARYNWDRYDRAPTSLAGAVYECAFLHAHLPMHEDYAVQIFNGLPNGSDVWLYTADKAEYRYATGIHWAGAPGAAFDVYANSSWLDPNAAYNTYRFRCMGVSTPLRNDNAYPNEFELTTTRIKLEQFDNPAGNLVSHVDTCVSRGGHLATSRDLHEGIIAGLPNGSGNWLFTGDGTHTPNTSGSKWTGVDLQYDSTYATYVTWLDRSTSYYGRCAFYPLDTSITGPAAASCNGAGGCFQMSYGGNPAPSVWMDRNDRVAANWATAAKTCVGLGGHLPTERDYHEAIRSGLPNGAGGTVYVWTSDMFYTNQAGILRWTGTGSTAWTPVGNVTNDALSNNRAYRCAWTNELR